MGINFEINLENEILDYFFFQKKIQKYLNQEGTLTDNTNIEEGYIAHPDWTKNWKNNFNYNLLYTNLNSIGTFSKFNKEQIKIFEEHMEKYIKKLNKNIPISCDEQSFFMQFYRKELSEKDIEIFLKKKDMNELNKKEQNLFKKVEYIFKKQMIIIIFKKELIIKIIFFSLYPHFKINKLYNLTIYFHFENPFDSHYNMFKKKDSKELIQYFISLNIFNEKKIIYYDEIASNETFTIFNEEKKGWQVINIFDDNKEKKNLDFIKKNENNSNSKDNNSFRDIKIINNNTIKNEENNNKEINKDNIKNDTNNKEINKHKNISRTKIIKKKDNSKNNNNKNDNTNSNENNGIIEYHEINYNLINEVSYRGLENVGAPCYMNATLLCLANIKEVTRYLLDPNIYCYLYDNNSICPITLEYTQVLLGLYCNESRTGFYCPKNFKNIISEYNPLFSGVKANDSKDLIIFLLGIINKELVQIHNEKKGIKNNDKENKFKQIDNSNEQEVLNNFIKDFIISHGSIIGDNLCGFQKSVFLCQSCKGKAINFNIFNFLIFSLEATSNYYNLSNNNCMIPNINFDNCFQYLSKSETFSDTYCQKCGRTGISQYSEVIYSMPNYLIIILNRGKGNIFNCNVQIPETFNPCNYVEKEKNNNFNLIGIVSHFGESGMGGHFIAFCKHNIDGKWRCFNDSIVTECQNDYLKKGTPYILFYQKQSINNTNSSENKNSVNITNINQQMNIFNNGFKQNMNNNFNQQIINNLQYPNNNNFPNQMINNFALNNNNFSNNPLFHSMNNIFNLQQNMNNFNNNCQLNGNSNNFSGNINMNNFNNNFSGNNNMNNFNNNFQGNNNMNNFNNNFQGNNNMNNFNNNFNMNNFNNNFQGNMNNPQLNYNNPNPNFNNNNNCF